MHIESEAAAEIKEGASRADMPSNRHTALEGYPSSLSFDMKHHPRGIRVPDLERDRDEADGCIRSTQ
jgi:hypothetical protein